MKNNKSGMNNFSWANERYEKLLTEDVPPAKLGNRNKTGKCGMCGTKANTLYPEKVGQVDFMICENCKQVMDL